MLKTFSLTTPVCVYLTEVTRYFLQPGLQVPRPEFSVSEPACSPRSRQHGGPGIGTEVRSPLAPAPEGKEAAPRHGLFTSEPLPDVSAPSALRRAGGVG